MSTEWFQYKLLSRTNDTLSMMYINPLLKGNFLPFTNSSMRPSHLACIINDLFLNKRKYILEFGSGISTILMARLIYQQNLNSKIFSIENDENWIVFIQDIIDKENLENVIKIIYAPLANKGNSINDNQWYDVDSINSSISKDTRFDMVVIDGPPAWEPEKKESRYPALPFVINRLNDNCCVYLDDADREGERLIIGKYKEEFGVQFKITGGALAYFYKGAYLNPIVEK